jgi:Flp pilus assembly protein TadG
MYPSLQLSEPGRRAFRRFFATKGRAVAGAMGIELALIFPALVLCLICVSDLGFGVYRKMQVQTAAQAGAEYAALRGYFDQTGVANAILAATNYSAITASPQPKPYCGCASQTGVVAATCGSTCASGSTAGQFVQASASATYQTILAYPMLPRSFAFTAQSTVRIR